MSAAKRKNRDNFDADAEARWIAQRYASPGTDAMLEREIKDFVKRCMTWARTRMQP